MNKPIIGITMGDPAGIGTEIIGKAFSDKMIYEICNPVLIGDKLQLMTALELLEIQLKPDR